MLARRALEASVDPLDLPLCCFSPPARVKPWKIGQGLCVRSVCRTQEGQIMLITLPSGPQKDLVRGMAQYSSLVREIRLVHTGWARTRCTINIC